MTLTLQVISHNLTQSSLRHHTQVSSSLYNYSKHPNKIEMKLQLLGLLFLFLHDADLGKPDTKSLQYLTFKLKKNIMVLARPPRGHLTDRIYGGKNAVEGQFPFIAHIGSFCTGTIVDKYFVLTAAHCTA